MEVQVIVPVGDDITAGFRAKLCDVPPADLARWYGPAAASLTDWPVVASMPGVRSWLHRLPHATVEERPITGAGSNTIEIGGTPLITPTDVGTWIWITENATGQGQYRRIVEILDGGFTLNVNAVFNPSLTDVGAGLGTLKIIRDSHRVTAGTTLLVITKHPDTPAFTSAVVGKTVIFFHGYDADPAGLAREIVAQTSQTITLDEPLPDVPPNDSGFAVLTGANAVQDLADITAGAALVPFGLNLDIAPVYSTGQDRCFTGDMGTPFASPLHELGLKLTVASSDEATNSVTVSDAAFTQDDVGAPAKIGSQTYTIAEVVTSTEAILEETLSPLPGAGDRLILVRSTVNFVPQLAWRVRQRSMLPVVVVELGSTGATILPSATPPDPAFAWAREMTGNDLCPSSDASLYVVLKAALLSCKALIEAEGNTAKFYVVVNCADHDAVSPNYQHIGTAMRVLRDALRVAVGDDAMPFIAAGPSAYGQGPPDLRPDIYTQLAALKATDAWTSYVDTRGGVEKASDGLRLSATGQIALADMLADELFEVLDREGALPDAANFVVEDGTGLPSATSLCSVEFADAYLQDYEDPAAWRTATTKRKRDALRRMSRWITYRRRYAGERMHGDQALAFPRVGLTDEDGFVIDHTTVPTRVQQATAYGAWRIVAGDWDPFPDESVDGGLGAKTVHVGPIQISKSYVGPKQSQTETRLPIVDSLLAIFAMPTVAGRLGRG